MCCLKEMVGGEELLFFLLSNNWALTVLKAALGLSRVVTVGLDGGFAVVCPGAPVGRSGWVVVWLARLAEIEQLRQLRQLLVAELEVA